MQDVFRKKDYVFFDNQKAFNLNIYGIRTFSDSINSFDDYIGVIYRDDTLEWVTLLFAATTDPGKYWLNNPISTKGTAILVPGQYQGAWKLGLHQGKYEALCQKKPVKVYRDDDKDNELDFDPEDIEEGIFGINIHRSNPYTESYYVDKWSAGCQVFKKIADYNRFMVLIRKAKELYGNSFTYTLLTEKDFLDLHGII